MSNLKLGVEVLEAHNLTPKDGLPSSGFFVEIQFSNEKLSTSTREQNSNAVWNERFFFNIPDPSLLPNLTLEASVYAVSPTTNNPSLLGKVRLSGTSFAAFSDSKPLHFPLEKRTFFSRARGELSLKVYLTDHTPPPPPSPGHVFQAQPSPSRSPTIKKTKPKQVFHSLPKQKPQTHEMKSSAKPPAMIFSSAPSYSPPTKPFTPSPWAGEKRRGSHNLVQPMQYLFVRVVKARDLAAMEIAGSVDPYVEVKLGNYTGQTRTFDSNDNPEWNQVFAFSSDRLQSSELIVKVKDKSLLKDEFLGLLRIDLREVPHRVPPDSPLAPEWRRLESKKGEKLMPQLMLAVWFGSQADEAFPDAILSDSISANPNESHHLRAKVYHSPRLWYVRVKIIEAQDIVPADKTMLPEIMVKASIGKQVEKTSYVAARNMAASWDKEFVFVAAEPFEEDLVLSLSDKTEEIGILLLKLSSLEKRWDEKPAPPRWYVVEKNEAIDVDQLKKHKFSSRLHLSAYLDGGYHVFDEPTQFCSDLRPTAKELAKKPIGVLELGILGGENLSPVKNRDGKGSADVYCVAKYGQKWVRTRTAVDNLHPKFNEQYNWEVFDPSTVLTVTVFHNNHGAAADKPMGKVRIRLSTLETGRTYDRAFPLLVLDSSAVKRNGDLHLAVRFSSTGIMNVMWKYAEPVFPKLHYKRPISPLVQENLRRRAMEIVAARLGRMEPPLRKEVVEYVNEVGSKLWSIRKGKAHYYRLLGLLSGPLAAFTWFGSVCEWKNTSTTVLVHLLFVLLVMFPELILPTGFLYMFVVGLWNYFHRARQPSGIDARLSQAENAISDEVDEELDSYPSSRSPELIRARYDRMRIIVGQIQTVAGEIAGQGERIQALLSWRDPRATFVFWITCLVAAVVFYVIPFQLVALSSGLFAMRHPKLRSKSPSAPFNFFKRLPSRTDDLL